MRIVSPTSWESSRSGRLGNEVCLPVSMGASQAYCFQCNKGAVPCSSDLYTTNHLMAITAVSGRLEPSKSINYANEQTVSVLPGESQQPVMK